MRLRPKRLLFLTHRWLGIAMCLFFAVWFASGIVMMYVEYPELTEAERLDALPALEASTIGITASDAVRRAGQRCPLASLSLSAVGPRPAYHLVSRCAERDSVFADTGDSVGHSAREALALATVRSSGFAQSGATPRYGGAIEMDQWTVSESLGPHRPLHRVDLDDAARTVLYVSDTTGQIVRDTNAVERFWNWIGSTLHWIYPYQLRRHRGVWVELIVWLSVAGLISVLTGTLVGILRLRPRRGYGRRGMSPYRGVARWHHLLGLAFVVFVSTFMFSGLMSMSPWGLFAPALPAGPQIDRFTGGPLRDLARFPDAARLIAEDDAGIKEVEWRQIEGEGHLVFRRADDRRKSVLAAAVPDAPAASNAGGGTGDETDRIPRFGQDRAHVLTRRIDRAAARFLPDAHVVETEVLTEHDNYYYTRHNRYRPLPVYRVVFDDPARTWFYVDVATGAVVERHTRETRLGRWLYNGLHSLDFRALTRLGPGWDVTMIALSLAGFGFAVTSIVVGWRRLRMN